MTHKEGFLCPVCITEFVGVTDLQKHWASIHETEKSHESTVNKKGFQVSIVKIKEQFWEAELNNTCWTTRPGLLLKKSY